MRCNNCGWENVTNLTKCIKCNTPLVETALQQSQNSNSFAGTILETSLPDADNKANFSFAKSETAPPDDKEELIACVNPECQYLFSPELSTCPRCRQAVNNFQTNKPGIDADKGKYYKAGDNEMKKYEGTIDPYRKKSVSQEVCYFKLVLKENEIIDPALQTKEFKFEQNAIKLNRANLDEQNNTITSNAQAEIFFENGSWFISDKSELKTTFINVGDKTALNEGVMILIGDRKFIFSMEKAND